jgi:thiol-disulfide isomerase/thioredoxin
VTGPRPRRFPEWLGQLALALLILLGFRVYQQRNLPTGTAPEWSAVTDLAGNPVKLAEFRGAAVMLHFWASWCGVCKAEQHNVVAVAEDLPVVAVASRSGSAADVRAYLKQHPMPAKKVLVDPDGVLARRYQVSAFPTSFWLDGEGNIRHAEVGYTSELGMRLRMWLSGL